jgi:hypothetical protein
MASGWTQLKTLLPTISVVAFVSVRRSHDLVAAETFTELFPSNSRLLASHFGFWQTCDNILGVVAFFLNI